METKQANQTVNTREINFPNGNRAHAVIVPLSSNATDVLRMLGIQQPRSLILVIGGAASIDRLDEGKKSLLAQLFSRGIARVAAGKDALIIDGGTHSGVMAMMGKGVADQGRQSVLLGIAPAGKVTYPGGTAEGSIENGAPLDPNHSHFVLVDTSDWGGETEMMFELAKALLHNDLTSLSSKKVGATIQKETKGASSKTPVVVILTGGESITKNELLHSVRLGWPIIAIAGNGGLADKITDLLINEQSSLIPDPDLAEIIADGNILIFKEAETIEALKQIIVRQLGEDTILKMAWERFAVYDENAKRHQKSFNWLQKVILGLGVFTTGLVLTQTFLKSYFSTQTSIHFLGLNFIFAWVGPTSHYTILILSILISVLIAGTNRFNQGSKWVLLRGSAEAIKRAIYRYRTRPANNNNKKSTSRTGLDKEANIQQSNQEETEQTTREAELARQIEFHSRQLMQTNVNVSALRPYKGHIPPKYAAAEPDDGFSFLTPDQYIALRLDDQLGYYNKKTVKLERQFKFLQWAILIVGGVGTFLAAIHLELWVALTTSLATAFTTYFGYQQVENTLIQYNQAATNLSNIKSWWMSLSPEEQANQKNIGLLVDNTEKVLESELSGWVQHMQDALAELSVKQAEHREKGKKN
ncbi:MAG: DUF4231 domain-containing protein [Candidatus Brocadia sp.]|nr:DUF4231 domain-containing protein [Candidatus Brocadia sp.]